MTRPYIAFRAVAGGATQTQAAAELGVSQPTICRELTRLCQKYPGLRHALRICRIVHQAEAEAA